MPDRQGRAERRPVVAGRRLDAHVGKGRVFPDLAVHDAVERAAPGEGQPALPRAAVNAAEDVERGRFEDRLGRGGDGLVARLDRLVGPARGTEQPLELRGPDAADHGLAAVPGHVDAARVVAEIPEVQLEAAPVVTQVMEPDDRAQCLGEIRRAIGRESHDLVLVAVAREAQVLRQREVEHPEGVWEVHPAHQLEPPAAAHRP